MSPDHIGALILAAVALFIAVSAALAAYDEWSRHCAAVRLADAEAEVERDEREYPLTAEEAETPIHAQLAAEVARIQAEEFAREWTADMERRAVDLARWEAEMREEGA